MSSSVKKNTIYNMIKTLAGIIFPLITFPYVSHVLQPENVGKVNFGSSIVSYFSLAATLGVATYAVRECSAVRANRNKLEQTASEIISINIVTMIVSYTVLVICLIFVPKFVDYRLLISIQSLAIFLQVIGADWLNTSMEDFRYITIRIVAFQFISLILMFVLIRGPEDYLQYAVVSLVSSSAGQLCNVFYRRKYGRVHFVRRMNWKKHMPGIIGLFALILSQTIMNSIDQTMLGFMKGDYEVGLYSVAARIITIVVNVVASISTVLLPQLSKAFNNRDYKSVNRTLNKTLNFTVTLTLPCFVGLVILSREVLSIIGGQEYAPANSCLIILCFGLVVDLLWSNLWGNCVLIPAKKEKQFIIACFIAMIVNVIGDYLMIPKWGIEGASFATVIAKMVIGIIVMLKKDKNISMGVNMKMLAGPLVGSAVIVVICIGIKMINLNAILTVLISVALSVIAYGIIMILLKNELVMDYLESAKQKFCKH